MTKEIVLLIPEEVYADLEKEGQARGQTASEVAAKFLIESRGNPELNRLWKEILALRGDVAIGVQALLVASGQMSAGEAKLWVSKNLDED